MVSLNPKFSRIIDYFWCWHAYGYQHFPLLKRHDFFFLLTLIVLSLLAALSYKVWEPTLLMILSVSPCKTRNGILMSLTFDSISIRASNRHDAHLKNWNQSFKNLCINCIDKQILNRLINLTIQCADKVIIVKRQDPKN